jgi:hypothetical protein
MIGLHPPAGGTAVDRCTERHLLQLPAALGLCTGWQRAGAQRTRRDSAASRLLLPPTQVRLHRVQQLLDAVVTQPLLALLHDL